MCIHKRFLFVLVGVIIFNACGIYSTEGEDVNETLLPLLLLTENGRSPDEVPAELSGVQQRGFKGYHLEDGLGQLLTNRQNTRSDTRNDDISLKAILEAQFRTTQFEVQLYHNGRRVPVLFALDGRIAQGIRLNEGENRICLLLIHNGEEHSRSRCHLVRLDVRPGPPPPRP